MALIKVDFLSRSLMRTVPIQVILPVDKLAMPGMPERQKKPFKTLYLLHGIFGNCTDWVSGTRVQAWAQEHDLAVVMPSGDNSFYVDHPSGALYGEYIGRELVDITREMFPLSDKREDTFIGGLSMGGYGAIRNGLKYAETFGCIAGLSAALVLESAAKSEYTPKSNMPIGSRSYYESVFGDLEQLDGSDMDLQALVKNLKQSGSSIPELYLACGTEDSLIVSNRKFRDFLAAESVSCTYVEGPGQHNWEFWNTYIEKVINWLPL